MNLFQFAQSVENNFKLIKETQSNITLLDICAHRILIESIYIAFIYFLTS